MSAPIALTQVGLMMTGVVDTLMVARIDVDSLAASAVANMWQWAWMSFGMGLVVGIDPLISQAHGRSDGEAAALALQRGVLVALVVSVPVALAMILTEPGLLLLGQQARVASLAGAYNTIKAPAIPCFLVYTAMRSYLQSRTLMAPATWVMWLANVLNVFFNWALIFGHAGMPRLGLNGAAIASTLTTAFLPLALFAWIVAFRLHRDAWRPWSRDSFSTGGLAQVARLGIPVGAQMSLEAWAFSMATFMAGWLGVLDVASHHIVLNMAALSFMVPLGISQGAAARVGNLIGAGDREGMRRAITGALLLGGGVMSISATLFMTLRHYLPLLYTDDAAVLSLSALILPLAGAFQLSDGTQVVAGGVLRGMGRPDAAAYTNLVGYYIIALPLAYLLGFTLQVGLEGVWIALVVGLTAVAAIMVVWVRRTARRPLSELSVRVAEAG